MFQGKMDPEVLDALLETVPFEFSIIGADDKVMCWNRHETRLFKRSPAVLGRDVRDCHPKGSLDKVETILSQMRQGKRNNAKFWIDLPCGKNGEKEKILIQYFALRGKDGQYLGCLELSQNIAEIQSLTGTKRLLD